MHVKWILPSGLINQNATLAGGIRGALWLPEGAGVLPAFLLEEGCHSAGFNATIHKRHHLLLSIGWRFNLFAPAWCRKYVTNYFECQ